MDSPERHRPHCEDLRSEGPLDSLRSARKSLFKKKNVFLFLGFRGAGDGHLERGGAGWPGGDGLAWERKWAEERSEGGERDKKEQHDEMSREESKGRRVDERCGERWTWNNGDEERADQARGRMERTQEAGLREAAQEYKQTMG